MSIKKWKPTLERLGGLVEIGTPADTAGLQAQCKRLVDAGFSDAYLGDLFLEIVPKGRSFDPERMVFDETDGVLQFREEAVLENACTTIRESGLSMESAHYHQVLPPPGRYPDAAVMAYHQRALAIAGHLGLKRVTTHPGWMFGSAMPEYNGAAAKAFRNREISITDLNRAAFDSYGGEAVVWRDSVDLYKRLCDWGGAVGVTITIETAISEWYGLTLHPERMHEFLAAVAAPNLGFCLDSGHCHLNGLDVAAMLRACAPTVCETHFHDNHGTRDEHRPIGEGTIPWPAVVRALRETGYEGLITFEHKNPERSALIWREFLSS